MELPGEKFWTEIFWKEFLEGKIGKCMPGYIYYTYTAPSRR